MMYSRRRMSVPRGRAIGGVPCRALPCPTSEKRRSVGVGLDGSEPPLKTWDVSGSLRESDRAAGSKAENSAADAPRLGLRSRPPTFSECRKPQPLPDQRPRGPENAKNAGPVAYGGNPPPAAASSAPKRVPPCPCPGSYGRLDPSPARSVPITDRLVLCGYPPVCDAPMT